MKKRDKSIINLYWIISIFFLVSVIYPLIILISKINFNNFSKIVNSSQFQIAFSNSIHVTILSTIISVLLAYILAFSINRCNIKHKTLLQTLFIMPMLIPSISHGISLINLFGTNGLINRLFNLNISIFGFWGITLGSIIYSFPIAFLIISDAFNYIDNSMYETAKVLGLNKWQTFKKVTLYYLKKPILSSIFAVFTMIFTDYGVPISIGARYETLPVFLYREVIGLLDFDKGTIIGLFLLIPAIISFLYDLFSKEKGSNNFVNKSFMIEKNKKRDYFFTIIVYLTIFFEIILFLSFIIISFVKKYPYDMTFSIKHYKYVLEGVAFYNLKNSLIISIFTSIFGTVISYLTSYVTSRINSVISKIMHVLAISSLAIPGIVLGISYSLSFNNTFIYNTYTILIIVNMIHFFASPYLMSYNALGKLNHNYEQIGTTCGISRFRIIKDVIIPCTKSTILEMFSYFFINSMITISAVTFLFNINTMPLSLLINQYEGQLMLEETAIVSLLIFVINVFMKELINLFQGKNKRRLKWS